MVCTRYVRQDSKVELTVHRKAAIELRERRSEQRSRGVAKKVDGEYERLEDRAARTKFSHESRRRWRERSYKELARSEGQ